MYGPPHLQRRSFLKLGIGSAIVLAVAGGALSLLQPGLEQGKLSSGARLVLRRTGQAMLAGTLPSDAAAQDAALEALLTRTDTFISALPDAVQAELSQLLSLLASAAGRRGLMGLSGTWQEASVAEVTQALQSMRLSSITLRQQAFQGLHDLAYAPYFSGQESWAVLGYPGPRAV
ncbi:MAG: hypothetical protein WCK83_09945 [Burkholderiales bacterium]